MMYTTVTPATGFRERTSERAATAASGSAPWYRRLAKTQSLIYIASGVWPLLNRRTFEAVTGPKVDFWLVRAVGSLITVVGGVLGAAAEKPARKEIVALGAGAAVALGTVSGYYALKGRIAKVYLLDAMLEFALAAGWVAVAAKEGAGDGG